MLAHVVHLLWQTHMALVQGPPFAKVGVTAGATFATG